MRRSLRDFLAGAASIFNIWPAPQPSPKIKMPWGDKTVQQVINEDIAHAIDKVAAEDGLTAEQVVEWKRKFGVAKINSQ